MEQRPRATVIISPRERYSFSAETLLCLFSRTTSNFSLVYVDVCSPPSIQRVLQARCAEFGATYVRHDSWLSPPVVRRLAMQHVSTDYVVYMDNDILVDEGWLEALLDCAERTGAGIVGPLYLEADGVNARRVHMAGGSFVIVEDSDGRTLLDEHKCAHADPAEISELQSAPCDFVEYHCFLAKSSLMKKPWSFDDDITSVHEHLDLALTARAEGESVYFTPAAAVTYLGLADYTLDDLEIFSHRWDPAEAERSIARFAEKWGVTNAQRSFDPVRNFLREHRAAVEPLDRTLADSTRSPTGPTRLAQSRSELLEQAAERGYGEVAIAEIAQGCLMAMYLAEGLHRPCGRPFLNHLIGTASALLLDGCSLSVVLAGLLHAAYSHTVGRLSDEQVCTALGGNGNPLERLVRAYTMREAEPSLASMDGDATEQGLDAAKVLLIEAANAADMRLSGEVSMSRRPDPLPVQQQAAAAHMCRMLGAHRLAALIEAPVPPATQLPDLGARFSFRLGPEFGRLYVVPTERPSLRPPDELRHLRSALEHEISRDHGFRNRSPLKAAVAGPLARPSKQLGEPSAPAI